MRLLRGLPLWALAAIVVLATAAAATLMEVSVRSNATGVNSGANAEGTTPEGVARVARAVGGIGAGKADWVVAENARPGATTWQLTDTGKPGDIEGFTDHVSAGRGDRVSLYVSTTAPSFVVEAYRMGYYGGKGGRLVWRSGTLPGARQLAPLPDPGTYTVEAHWTPSLTVNLDQSWPPGDYLFKLIAQTGPQQLVPLTVRDDDSRATYVLVNAVTTWQAYNLWGGHSLYEGRRGTSSDFEHRARIVSFDRPYANGAGSGDFLGNEFPLVSLAESMGLDVTYSTDIELHRHPDLLLRHRAVLTLGHDEYWSAAMRKGVESARDHGVNVAFFGANAVFRQIRLEGSPLGPERHEVAYKRAAEDPLRGRNDAEVTVNWREAPVNRPESTLVGDFYECNPVKADMVVADESAWVFAGTGLRTGDVLPDAVGSEYDRYDPNQPGPPGASVQVLAHSPVVCHGKPSFADMTWYSAPSGAGVFATGTNYWISRLGAGCPPGDCPHDDQVVRITKNVLRAFGEGPAGAAHPSSANYDRLSRTPATTPTKRSTATGRRSPGVDVSGEPEESSYRYEPAPIRTPQTVVQPAPRSSPPAVSARPSPAPRSRRNRFNS